MSKDFKETSVSNLRILFHYSKIIHEDLTNRLPYKHPSIDVISVRNDVITGSNDGEWDET